MIGEKEYLEALKKGEPITVVNVPPAPLDPDSFKPFAGQIRYSKELLAEGARHYGSAVISK